ncbi:hypothetical protein [Luteolibacter marinus]|uniref:hypothetical protein n=1 Tax=Luteolibacter marinus TaxID=2776705 RepID=UPI0018681E68|nr:hypothetical protein [Luteolibacter marinus]
MLQNLLMIGWKSTVAVVGFVVLAIIFRFSIFWLIPIAVVGLLLFVVVEAIKARQLFRKRGFQVRGSTDNGFIYREISAEGTRVFNLPGELVEPGHSVYYPIPEDVWLRIAPEWARGRKHEIESRIHEDPLNRPL